MKLHKKSTEVCNECEQEFIDEMNRMVGTVENYSPKDHRRKEDEVESAFREKHKQPVEQK